MSGNRSGSSLSGSSKGEFAHVLVTANAVLSTKRVENVVRHRKWALLGVKLPDFTVGMSSHCIIRGYSLSLASVKCEGETAPSLPERRFWAAIMLNDDV